MCFDFTEKQAHSSCDLSSDGIALFSLDNQREKPDVPEVSQADEEQPLGDDSRLRWVGLW